MLLLLRVSLVFVGHQAVSNVLGKLKSLDTMPTQALKLDCFINFFWLVGFLVPGASGRALEAPGRPTEGP